MLLVVESGERVSNGSWTDTQRPPVGSTVQPGRVATGFSNRPASLMGIPLARRITWWATNVMANPLLPQLDILHLPCWRRARWQDGNGVSRGAMVVYEADPALHNGGIFDLRNGEREHYNRRKVSLENVA
jgi:hypothetical protein